MQAQPTNDTPVTPVKNEPVTPPRPITPLKKGFPNMGSPGTTLFKSEPTLPSKPVKPPKHGSSSGSVVGTNTRTSKLFNTRLHRQNTSISISGKKDDLSSSGSLKLVSSSPIKKEPTTSREQEEKFRLINQFKENGGFKEDRSYRYVPLSDKQEDNNLTSFEKLENDSRSVRDAKKIGKNLKDAYLEGINIKEVENRIEVLIDQEANLFFQSKEFMTATIIDIDPLRTLQVQKLSLLIKNSLEIYAPISQLFHRLVAIMTSLDSGKESTFYKKLLETLQSLEKASLGTFMTIFSNADRLSRRIITELIGKNEQEQSEIIDFCKYGLEIFTK